MSTNLSPNFTLEELTITNQRIDNTPDAKSLNNLKALAVLLESIRSLVGAPIRVTSGYRSPAVNKAVGGSLTSAHSKGLAADINVKGLTSTQLATKIRDSGLKFDQLILEFPNTSSTWVHIGLSEGTLRQQVLTAVRNKSGKTEYLTGLRA